MLFSSPAFAVFLPLMLLAYWNSRGASRRVVLLLGSYLFYAWWDWRFLSLLWLSTVVDFLCGHAIARRQGQPSARRFLLVSIATNLSILGGFKYFNFFRDSAIEAFGLMGLNAGGPTLDIVLPMGISFYTFQTMSYTIDVYRGAQPEKSLLNFAVFVSCFPQLVAGPIMRAGTLLPQIGQDRTARDVDLSGGVYRIFRGLFKKMVVADALALYVDMVFDQPAGYAGFSSWIALYAYAFQIYMDFSGYTDVAIGVGKLLGLKFVENFDRPYLARSPSEFWHRWHISLSTWLRDYLYIPLGGSRHGSILTIRNLMITMMLGGLWHGAAWTFVAWGVFHGVLLTLERGWRAIAHRRVLDEGASRAGTAWAIARVLLMFHVTCLGWLLFRSDSWSTVMIMLGNLFSFGESVHGLRILAIVLACWAFHAAPSLATLGDRFARLPAMGQGALAGLCMWALLLLSPSAKPFIYFQF
ncbi:MAG: MBOAT family O-acyltransferase [Planctomycetota bacterium]|jgi:D-alanyl-lipoteichoic acid acyltransferase DltB (MBOAT superfamily)